MEKGPFAGTSVITHVKTTGCAVTENAGMPESPPISGVLQPGDGEWRQEVSTDHLFGGAINYCIAALDELQRQEDRQRLLGRPGLAWIRAERRRIVRDLRTIRCQYFRAVAAAADQKNKIQLPECRQLPEVKNFPS